jgi:hypothetical protein
MTMWGDASGAWEPLTDEQIAEADEARERDRHFIGDAGQLAPHDYQCDNGCGYESDADRDARIDHEEECYRLREEEARELEAG